MIGDKNSDDPQNRIRQGQAINPDEIDGNGVPRAIVRLETNAKDASDPRGDEDNKLWKVMNNASVEIAKMLAGKDEIQYLSKPNSPRNAVWQPDPPLEPDCQDTLSSTHHEGGTLWMDKDPATSVTNQFGKIWELENLYIVGPAVLLTLGSPNLILSGVALSWRTADHLVGVITTPPIEAGFEFLFNGAESTFKRWRSAGPGSFALIDGMLVAQPGKPAFIGNEGV